MPILTAELDCRLLDACIIAYDIKGDKIDDSTPYYKHVGFQQGTGPQVFVSGDDGIDAGFVGETHDDWVLVVFRGTLPPFEGSFWKWVSDWLHDFEVGPMDWKVNGSSFGKVETGFGDAVLKLWPGMSSALDGIDLRAKRGVLVTGHSKGGGMSFPAATLVKAAHRDVFTEVRTFAAPLTCDRTFEANYYNMGFRTFTARYQNMYDIVPFLPYWPYFSLLATAERRATGGNAYITEDNWPSQVENDYVPLGNLRYLGDGCRVETGTQGQEAADKAIWHALDHLELDTIVDAHSARGRYHQCVCDKEA